MNPGERHERAFQLFDEVCDLPPEQREPYLAAHCDDPTLRAEVEALLRQDAEQDAFLDAGQAGAALDALAAQVLGDPAEDMPERIGPYRIIRTVGQGGMGIIYEAEQESPQRRVALKVLQPGVVNRPMLRRFEREAQVLGQLQHPGIAQIYEAGLADSAHGRRPFFAMELIDGLPLNQHADAAQLSTHQRLELLARVCDALQHAHQKGIIHRDLKPANVLVLAQRSATATSGTLAIDDIGMPKVLDFGIARVTDGDLPGATLQTEAGQLIGTLAYMSPEQIRGDTVSLDTRCDVYALGVMLYELVAGRRPHALTNLALPEAARVVQETEPPTLGTLQPSLRGDIETIVAKAMEKDRERRYGSAADLAADLRRYLSNEPIQARPATTLYLLSRFARRNRAMVLGLAGTFLMLVVALAATTFGLVQAEARRKAATAANEQLQTMVNYQSALLSGIDVAEMGQRIVRHLREEAQAVAHDGADEQVVAFESLLARMNPATLASRALHESIMTRAVAALDDQFAAQPQLRADLQHTLAGIYDNIGLDEESLAQYRAEFATRTTLLGSADPTTLAVRFAIGELLRDTGAYEEAEAHARQLLADRTTHLGARHVDTLATQRLLGDILVLQTRPDEALIEVEAALAGLRDAVGDEHPETVAAWLSLGRLHFQNRRFEPALDAFERARHIQAQRFGAEAPQTLASLAEIAQIHFLRNDFEQARELLQQHADALEATLGSDHPATLTARYRLANALTMKKDYETAEPIVTDTLARLRRVLGNDHPRTATALGAALRLATYTRRWDEADTYGREALAIALRTMGPDNAATLIARSDLSLVYIKSERHAEAERAVRHALAEYRRVLGPEHPRTLVTEQLLCKALLSAGRFEQAAEQIADLLPVCRRVDPQSPIVAGTLGLSVNALLGVDRAAEALQHAEELLAWCEEREVPVAVIGRCHLWIARAEYALDQLEDAERSLGRALEHLGETPPEHWAVRLCHLLREVVGARAAGADRHDAVRTAYAAFTESAGGMSVEDRNAIVPEVRRIVEEIGITPADAP